MSRWFNPFFWLALFAIMTIIPLVRAAMWTADYLCQCYDDAHDLLRDGVRWRKK